MKTEFIEFIKIFNSEEWCENVLVGHHPPTSGEAMQYPVSCGNTVISGCSNPAPHVY